VGGSGDFVDLIVGKAVTGCVSVRCVFNRCVLGVGAALGAQG
jgi:hypothetical protein